MLVLHPQAVSKLTLTMRTSNMSTKSRQHATLCLSSKCNWLEIRYVADLTTNWDPDSLNLTVKAQIWEPTKNERLGHLEGELPATASGDRCWLFAAVTSARRSIAKTMLTQTRDFMSEVRWEAMAFWWLRAATSPAQVLRVGRHLRDEMRDAERNLRTSGPPATWCDQPSGRRHLTCLKYCRKLTQKAPFPLVLQFLIFEVGSTLAPTWKTEIKIKSLIYVCPVPGFPCGVAFYLYTSLAIEEKLFFVSHLKK
jgi:hypothetical protein